MISPKISVIIPVYNAEKCLHRCINSILSQAFSDFEVLLIDDGSNDDSGAICDDYANKDSRIRVFHKSNGGVSSARNFGIENAKGEWICFMDSDDEINGLENIFAVDFDSDIIFFNLRITHKNGSSYIELPQLETGCIKNKTNYIIKYVNYHIFNSVCAKLIRKNIIGAIRFDTSIKFGEDSLFFLQLFGNVTNIGVFDKVEYTYYRYEDYGSKYDCSIESSVYTLRHIFAAYQALGCRNIDFERNVFNCYRMICQYEWHNEPRLWNNNKIVASIYSKIKDAYPFSFRLKYWIMSIPVLSKWIIKIRDKFNK